MAAVAERMSDNAVRARLREIDGDEPSDAIPQREKRRAPELLAGLLLVLGGALGGLYFFQRGNESHVVVATADNLQRGTVLTRTDLVALELPRKSDGIGVSAADAGSLLGKRLLVDLPQGRLVEHHVLTEELPLGPSEALIPLALPTTAVPSGLSRGDLVRLVMSFPDEGPEAPAPEMLNETMEVFDVARQDEFSDAVTVTVRAPADASVDIARADRIQLLKVAGR